MRIAAVVLSLALSACSADSSSAWDQSWETSARPVDHQQPPGALALTLTGPTSVEEDTTETWTVSGADLLPGDQVILAWGGNLGAGRCPFPPITGGGLCMGIVNPARPLATATATADPLNPGQGIATFDVYVQPTARTTVHLQAISVVAGRASTTNTHTVTITDPVVNAPTDPKFSHLSTEAEVLSESVVCLTEASGQLWAVGMETGATVSVPLGGNYDLDLTAGIGTVFGQPAAIDYEKARRGSEVWTVDAFTGMDVYADPVAFAAGMVSQHYNRPGTSSRIAIENNQGYAMWHSGDEITWFDTATGSVTNTVTMTDHDEWVVGLSANAGLLYMINMGDSTYSHLGRRITVADPATGVDVCNVFLPSGGATYPYGPGLPMNASGLYCFTPPAVP